MKAIELELQAFKDLDVYDTVSRKTIPRGAEIIYTHIVLDKKYKEYGKKGLYDGKEETCWNSGTGLPQSITVKYPAEQSNLTQIKFIS